MSEALTIPAWVPDGVRLMYEVSDLKNDCAQRLLTDERMKPAWTQLKSLIPTDDTPTPSYYPPSLYIKDRKKFINGCSPEEYRDLDRPLTDFDRLSAALYFQVVIAFSQPEPVPVWTTAEAKAMAKPFLDAAKLCETSIEVESAWQYGNPPKLIKEDLVNALKATRDYLAGQGQMRLMANNPRVLKRSRGEDSDTMRAHARVIAVLIRDLFGPFKRDFPHAAVARILTVSLNRNEDLDDLKKTIPEWCDDLPTPISATA
ncbi:hypothetical protein MKK88_30890 [Methylobacterium sp. E-005]|uniref:hypothetical protein n=1 Tax=Methylobacterium sp. E-005 TaxID=2836549 RepID=UPI001FB9CFC7|nr:hypothetical protein [Methylobacterium sp. E-005]MCJ2090358.1 hypothetical protein [Methylobacterium sp. E-005]